MLDELNFLVTNRIPRQLLTRFMGWFTRIETPIVYWISMGIWRLCTGLDLSEAKRRQFASVHECFVRELKPGVRPVDPDAAVLVSPVDGIVGACGRVQGTELLQIKGFPYTLPELLADEATVARYVDGTYVTIRLPSSAYHRFHAPADGVVDSVVYVSGDCWNTHPVTLRRIEKLYCRNERALLELRLTPGAERITLVAVAAVLVASIRLNFLNVRLHLRYKGPNRIPCVAPVQKGLELGWFEHGSTMIVLAPAGFAIAPGVEPGLRIRMGEALLRRP
jgi:phosphatidylserine decarboxylase